MNVFLWIIKALVSGFLTGVAVSIPLGPSGIESVKRTISKGFKYGFILSLGAIVADFTYLILINYGFSNIISKNTKIESIFFIISGSVLALASYNSIKASKTHADGEKRLLKNEKLESLNFITGFLITFFNPMTPSIWLMLSGTFIKNWHSVGSVYYYFFIVAIMVGMITWFAMLNYLALKGINVLKPNMAQKTSVGLMWIILIMGVCFQILGIYKFSTLVFK
jgi:threonine/homoserine/homoserine lactone efflux protein